MYVNEVIVLVDSFLRYDTWLRLCVKFRLESITWKPVKETELF